MILYIIFTYIKNSILGNRQNLSMLLLLSRYLKYLSRFMKLIKGRLESVALKPPPLIDLQTFIVCATVCVRECVCAATSFQHE